VLDINECVVESSCANFFWSNEGCWQTANITQAGIAGLMRANIINTMDIMVVPDVKIMDLNAIEAAFICNSVMGIVPIKTYKKKMLSLTRSHSFHDDFFAKFDIAKS
jgi:4-amino-4-deoxychorismate lyase